MTNLSFDVQLEDEYIYHGQGVAFYKSSGQLDEKAVRDTYISTFASLLMSDSRVGIQRSWLIKASTTLDVSISI